MTVQPATQCSWEQNVAYTCVGASRATCSDGEFDDRPPYCQRRCEDETRASCNASHGCYEVLTAEASLCATNWCHFRAQFSFHGTQSSCANQLTEELLTVPYRRHTPTEYSCVNIEGDCTIDRKVVPNFQAVHFAVLALTVVGTIGVLGKNFREYKKELMPGNFKWEYKARKHVMDVISIVMALVDFALDVRSLVAAYKFDYSIGQGISDVTLVMLTFVLVPHLLRAGLAAHAAWGKAENGQDHKLEAVKAFGLALLLGQGGGIFNRAIHR